MSTLFDNIMEADEASPSRYAFLSFFVSHFVPPPLFPKVLKLYERKWPDHRIAARLKLSEREVIYQRRQMGIECGHPPESRLTEEQVSDELEKWSRFIWKYAKGWVRKYPKLREDDVHSEAVIGAIRAGERFDPRRLNKKTNQPLKFTTYAVHWMRNQVQRYAQRELCFGLRVADRGRIKRLKVSQWPENESGGIDDFHPDGREPPRLDPVLSQDELLDRLTDGLTETERRAVVLRFKDGLSVAHVSWWLGMLPDEADRLLASATLWMKRKHDNMDVRVC